MTDECEKVDALVDQMIDGCADIIDRTLENIPCAAMQNAAVSQLGLSIASSTLRSVTDEDAAKKIASSMILALTAECATIISEIWSDRGSPQ